MRVTTSHENVSRVESQDDLEDLTELEAQAVGGESHHGDVRFGLADERVEPSRPVQSVVEDPEF